MNEKNKKKYEAIDANCIDLIKYCKLHVDGRGSFEMVFDRYQRAPNEVAERVIKESNYKQASEE